MARLTKSRNHWIQGVLGGLGVYLNVNPDLLRVCFLVAVFIFDWDFLIAAYVIMMIIMPQPHKADGEEIMDVESGTCERQAKREHISNRTLQVLGILLILGGISFIVRYQFPDIWYSFQDYLRVVRHTFSNFREVIVGLVLIVVGYFLLIKPKRG